MIDLTDIQKQLFLLQDKGYGDFQSRLMPDYNRNRIIGVRTPALRKLANSLYRSGDKSAFSLPHEYYEEYNLHGFLIEKIRDFDACVAAIEEFLPFVDNWATCDCVNPPVFSKNREKLYPFAVKWINSGKCYTVRYGIKCIMNCFLDDGFKEEYLDLVADVKSDEYYVKMMQAWFFATALAKQYDAAVKYFVHPRLEPWTHNKAIQKARESFRISKEQKEYLNSLKIKQ